jgi:hypothetical protein
METTVYVIETSDDLYSRPYEFYCVCAKKEDADARALGLKDIYAYVTVTPYYLL